MDDDTIFNTIRELGHINSKREELREFCKIHIEQIIKNLPRRILNSNGSDLLDCIFNGLVSNFSSQCKSKIKIIDIVLETMRKESVSLTHCGDVVSRLCLELPNMPSDDLVKWFDDSVKSIQDDSDVNMIWRDVLPECLNALSSKHSFKYCDTEITVSGYREQHIYKLCEYNWNERQLVQLTAMFKDMHLSPKEHKQVVNKICSYMIDIPPDSLPPLIHQLLKLCKTYNMDVALSYLSHYFSARLYGKLDPPPQDSEATTMDIDDIVQYSSVDLSRCLSTCIYHISQGAAEPELIKKHIKSWPKTQLLRSPFMIDIALAMSDKGADFRSVCLDVIKSAVELRVLDEKRRNESAWVRSVLPPDMDVAGLFKTLTTESANHRQLTVVGLINLAFSLLGVSRLKPSAQACWSHGKLVLVRLVKSQPETAGHVLTKLADRLATDCALKQYAECLHVLCKLAPVAVERCTQLRTILENCQPSSSDYQSAAAIYDAVHPLLNFSTRTRDVLIMVCRKGLHSRDPVHRCLALSGVLTVLRHVKLTSGAFSNSQDSSADQYGSQSYLTQLTVDLHATQHGAAVTSRVRNEAICMEIVSILRRCLVQDATVRQLLYSSLYDCVKEKIALHESVLELFYEHLNKYLPESGDNKTLLLDKCVRVNDVTVVLMEPISYLLYVIAQFLQSCDEEDLEDILASQSAETSGAHLNSKLKAIMEQLSNSENFGQIDLDDLNLSDCTLESKTKAIKVQQILQCYEALIAYQVMQLKATDTGANTVLKLFNACNRLIEHTKTPPKSSKKGTKSTQNDTLKSQKSQKSQKEKGKGPMKFSNLVKDRAGTFKALPCLWDPKFCLQILQLFYSEIVSWCSTEQRNKLAASRPLQRYAVRNVLSALAVERVHKRVVGTHIVAIGSLLYHRCLSRFKEMCDFDDQTTLDCIEVFKQCLTLLFSPKYSLKTENFLMKITNLEEDTHTENIAELLDKVHEALLHIEAESLEEGTDAVMKKMIVALTQIATILLELPAHSCSKLSATVTKLEEYVRTSKEDCLSLLPPLLAAGFREQQESQLMDDLLAKLDSVLGRIDEEDTSANDAEDTTNFPTIDSRTGHNVLNYICVHISDRLKCVDHLLARSRDLTLALNNATPVNRQRIDRELSETCDSCALQLCQVCVCVSKAARLRCAAGAAGAAGGAGGARVLAVCGRLYTALTALVKHAATPNASLVHSHRFERLLKLSGKKLSSVCDDLITYLEASQQQQNAAKVLRDTKLIPRLVLEAEQFSKNVILLANKTKINFQQYLSLGTARDFRIRAPLIQEVLRAREIPEINDIDSNVDINDAVTEVISPLGSDNEQEIEGSDDDRTAKRRKL